MENFFEIEITSATGGSWVEQATNVENLVFICESRVVTNARDHFLIEKWGQKLEGVFGEHPEIGDEIKKRWGFLSVTQVSEIAGKDVGGIRRNLASGRLKGVKLGEIWLVETDSMIYYYFWNSGR